MSNTKECDKFLSQEYLEKMDALLARNKLFGLQVSFIFLITLFSASRLQWNT